MWLIVGLGNPGQPYQFNRHNIGFMAVEAVHQHHNFNAWSSKFQGLIATGTVAGEKLALFKPQTYMNLSGQAVGEALRFYKIPLERLLIIHDELDLPPAKARLKLGGGSGGHNGIKSIDAHCGANYRRLRLGIGHPGNPALVHNYVLGNFAKADDAWLSPLLQALAEHIELFIKGKDSSFMNKLSLAIPNSTPTPNKQQEI